MDFKRISELFEAPRVDGMIDKLLQELALKDYLDVAAAQRLDEVLGAHYLRLLHLLISSDTTHCVVHLLKHIIKVTYIAKCTL